MDASDSAWHVGKKLHVYLSTQMGYSGLGANCTLFSALLLRRYTQHQDFVRNRGVFGPD